VAERPWGFNSLLPHQFSLKASFLLAGVRSAPPGSAASFPGASHLFTWPRPNSSRHLVQARPITRRRPGSATAARLHTKSSYPLSFHIPPHSLLQISGGGIPCRLTGTIRPIFSSIQPRFGASNKRGTFCDGTPAEFREKYALHTGRKAGGT
jgi:hypothetical protein